MIREFHSSVVFAIGSAWGIMLAAVATGRNRICTGEQVRGDRDISRPRSVRRQDVGVINTITAEGTI